MANIDPVGLASEAATNTEMLLTRSNPTCLLPKAKATRGFPTPLLVENLLLSARMFFLFLLSSPPPGCQLLEVSYQLSLMEEEPLLHRLGQQIELGFVQH